MNILELKSSFFYKLLLIIIAFFLSSLAYSQELRTAEDWEKVFLKNWEKEYKIAYPKSISNDSWQFYNIAYYIDANVTMYKAINKVKYIDRALFYVENIIDSATRSSKLNTSQFKDKYYGWINKSAPKKKYWGKEYPLFESFCWRYVSDLLVVIYNSDELKEKYAKNYKKILAFTQKNIYEKWISRGESNIYRSNVHMSSHWAKISMNLYLLTKKENYKKILDSFVEKFKFKLETEPKNQEQEIYWKTRWKSNTSFIQDVGHGNAVVDLIISVYENKLGFDSAIIDKLIYTFNTKIWKKHNVYSKYIDGSGKGSGWFTDGFIKLGRFDVGLQKRIEGHNKGRSTQFFGNGALNAKLIKMKREDN